MVSRPLVCVVLLACGISHLRAADTAALAATPVAAVAATPPWGELRRRAIVLAPKPEEWPNDETTPQPLPWVFHGLDRGALDAFLAQAGVAPAVASRLAESAKPAAGDGLSIDPSATTRLELAPSARATIYARLAQSPENQEQICAQRWTQQEFAQWQASSGLAAETLASLRGLTYDDDGLVAFADLAALCAQVPDLVERKRLMCAVVRAPALVVSLRLHARGGDEQAIRWWSAGDEDVERILRAFAARHEDVDIDLGELLPPMPRARLNRYPDAEERRFDCGWTALNFFAAKPDPALCEPDVVARVLHERYRALAAGEQLAYGDLVMFCLPDGRAVHAAVYLADDLLYTKNGATTMRPWKISDLASLRVSYHAAPMLTALRAVGRR